LELLQFLEDENYSVLGYHQEEQEHETFIKLEEVQSNEHLLSLLEIVPSRMEYYPLDRKPCIVFFDNERYHKIFLYKTNR